MPHTIEVLHVEGCGGAPDAERIARQLAARRRDVSVVDVLIADAGEAVRRGMRGSPTVLVDGDDIEIEPSTPLGAMG